MAEIEFDNVDKTYPDGTTAVKSLNLMIDDGEFMVFVGPSGCGKSTALRMVAGLEEITGGELRIGGEIVNDRKPQDRDIAMVFQDYALYPNMTVRQNMGFALRMMKLPHNEIDRRVQHAARTLSLTAQLDRRPRNLSGGQRQRVAMGRAIVREPKAFLMDEPLSNLDAKLRVEMRAEITALQHKLGVTTIYVTHDQIEAMTMGDRVAVLRGGELQQVASPQELYDDPVNLFVAGFIGSPRMNLFEGSLERLDGGVGFDFAGKRLTLAGETVARLPALEKHVGEPLIVGLRPEAITRAEHVPDDQRIEVAVEVVEALGNEMILHFPVPLRPALVDDTRDLAADLDPSVVAEYEEMAAKGESLIIGRMPPVRGLQAGARIQVGIDTSNVYLFDQDGMAVR
jgi:multiple sugar transport system ATP-binding protein